MRRSAFLRPQFVLGALALVCAGGLAVNLATTPRTARAERRFRDLLRAITTKRWVDLPAYFAPEFELEQFARSFPRPLLARFREMSLDAASLQALLVPLDLRLHLESAHSDEEDDGSVVLRSVVHVRGEFPSGMVPSQFSEVGTRGQDVDVTTTWKAFEGVEKITDARLERAGVGFPFH